MGNLVQTKIPKIRKDLWSWGLSQSNEVSTVGKDDYRPANGNLKIAVGGGKVSIGNAEHTTVQRCGAQRGS